MLQKDDGQVNGRGTSSDTALLAASPQNIPAVKYEPYQLYIWVYEKTTKNTIGATIEKYAPYTHVKEKRENTAFRALSEFWDKGPCQFFLYTRFDLKKRSKSSSALRGALLIYPSMWIIEIYVGAF